MSAIEMPYRTTFSCAQAACGTTSAVVVAAKSERRESFMMSPDNGKSPACTCDSRARTAKSAFAHHLVAGMINSYPRGIAHVESFQTHLQPSGGAGGLHRRQS